MKTVIVERVFLTPEEISQGLSYDYHPLKPVTVALFDMKGKPASHMWMKNTPRELDMIFVSEKHIVIDIHRCAIPFDETRIPIPPNTRFVLEGLCGYVDTNRLQKGDVVRFVWGGNGEMPPEVATL